MRSFLPVAVLLLLSSAMPVDAARDRGDTLADARKAGQATLRVLYVPSRGWAYQDESGRLTGVTVEIMRRFADHVASRHGIAVALEFVEETDWPEFYQRVRDGHDGVFGLGNVTITDERAGELAFSPPYVNNVAVLISHRDVPELVEPDELAETFSGLDALAFAGTLHETRLRVMRDRHWPDLGIALARTNDEIIEQVAAGGHFAYIDAYNYYRARELGAPLRRHAVLDDPGEAFGIIMPLDNDWQGLLTDFFDTGLTGSTSYSELLEQHLGPEVAALLQPE